MAIIGIVGRTQDAQGKMCSLGTGKDTVADLLVEQLGAKKISFADPIKRCLRDIFGLSQEQLWGESAERARIDPDWGFSAREALQGLGDGFGRGMHEDTWVRYLVSVIQTYTQSPAAEYSPERGLSFTACGGAVTDSRLSLLATRPVVVPDVRRVNEIQGLKALGAQIVLVYRTVDDLRVPEEYLNHPTEKDLNELTLDDPIWDYVIRSPNTPDYRAMLERHVQGFCHHRL